MVSHTWTRLSLEEMVVDSPVLVLAFFRGRNVCSVVCSQKFGPLEAIFLTTFVGLSVPSAGTRRQRLGNHLSQCHKLRACGAQTTYLIARWQMMVFHRIEAKRSFSCIWWGQAPWQIDGWCERGMCRCQARSSQWRGISAATWEKRHLFTLQGGSAFLETGTV